MLEMQMHMAQDSDQEQRLQEGIIDIKNQLEIQHKYKTEGVMFQSHS